jgi:thioredoxin reductase (NADPH)
MSTTTISIVHTNDHEIHDVIIIGSGPAAYTAAIYAGRANLEPIILQGMQPGGQLTTTTDVENYPGFEDGINGYELMNQMEKQSIKNGTLIKDEKVLLLDTESRPFIVHTDNNKYYAKTVIIASGATAKKLDIQGSDEYWMNGVSACAVCDGPLPIFRKRHLVVVGGGDTAMEEAMFLSRFASNVTIVHRSEKFRASKTMQERVLSNPKIQIKYNTEVVLVSGAETKTKTEDDEEIINKKLTHLTLKNKITNTDEIVECAGLFYAIGHEPNTQFIQNREHIKLDNSLYIITEPGRSLTHCPGVFACGDVMDKRYRQAITAAGTGCMAALDAIEYLEHHS